MCAETQTQLSQPPAFSLPKRQRLRRNWLLGHAETVLVVTEDVVSCWLGESVVWAEETNQLDGALCLHAKPLQAIRVVCSGRTGKWIRLKECWQFLMRGPDSISVP